MRHDRFGRRQRRQPSIDASAGAQRLLALTKELGYQSPVEALEDFRAMLKAGRVWRREKP